jgi:DNA-directed RNA polymerase subunit RPC12/RpoP
MGSRPIYECDRCGAEIANELGVSISCLTGRGFRERPGIHVRQLVLCANCRLDFENFIADLRKPLP